jgi:hypothetical protein
MQFLSLLYSALHLVQIFLHMGKLLAFIVLALGAVYGKYGNWRDRFGPAD